MDDERRPSDFPQPHFAWAKEEEEEEEGGFLYVFKGNLEEDLHTIIDNMTNNNICGDISIIAPKLRGSGRSAEGERR